MPDGATLIAGDPLTLPCGVVVRNRLVKAAMSESLADPQGRPGQRLCRLYEYWGRSEAAVMFTGNVQVDECHLEEAGNMRIDKYWTDASVRDAFAKLASVSQKNGSQCWVQLSHAGRNTDQRVNLRPLAPSPIAVKGAKFRLSRPVEMTIADIKDVVEKFREGARAVKDAGFAGLQVHGAHGYLLSSFISPRSNVREDEYGGSLENRARFLLEVCSAVREGVGPGFPVALKLNSADFHRGGSTVEEAVRIAGWVEEVGVDVLEVSGGNMETKNMLGLNDRQSKGKSKSTKQREAYFLQYAEVIAKALSKTKLMVTGGFRKRSTIEYALSDGGVDVIGLGRPFLYCTDPARDLLVGTVDELPSFENDETLLTWPYLPLTFFANRYKLLASLAMKCTANLVRLGDGRPLIENPADMGMLDLCRFIWIRSGAAQRLKGPKCTGTVYSYNDAPMTTLRQVKVLLLTMVGFLQQIWFDVRLVLD